MDKEPTKWEDISPEARALISTRLGISDAEGWLRLENHPCPFCGPDPDHLVSRCVPIWMTTDRAKGMVGADKAARRVRDALGINSLEAIYESFLDSSVIGLCSEEVIHQALDRIVDSSLLLTHLDGAVASADDLSEQETVLALSEFERARAAFHQRADHFALLVSSA